MPALLEDLARRLDTSPEQAEELLQELFDRLRAHAQRTGEFPLPGLGTFAHWEGTWTFEPTEELARSVNHSFADLRPIGVSVSTLPDAPASDDSASDDVETEESTSPASASPGGSIFDRQPDRDPESEERSTRGLFTPERPPDDAAPTPEEASPPASSTDPDRAPSSQPPRGESPDTENDERDVAPASEEDDWSLPEESVSETQPARYSFQAQDYAALPAGYLVHRYSSPSPDALRDASPAPLAAAPDEGFAPTREEAPDTPEARRADDRPGEARTAPDADSQERKGTRRRQSSGNGSWTRWGAVLLTLLLAGGGAWYFVGQQDAGSDATVALQQPEQQSDPSTEDPAPASAAPDGEATSAGDAMTSEGTAPPAPSAASTGAAPDGEATSAGDDTTGEGAFADADRLDRAQGGWTVVVASETAREEAERVARRFAKRFQEQDYPIDILETTVEGTQRFRVVVGQFSSSDQVIQTIEQDTSRLPPDAWGLEIDSGN
jgi:hypothetical protein